VLALLLVAVSVGLDNFGASAAISVSGIDNLVIGFALGAYHVNLILAAVMIAVMSVALSLLGLEIGRRLGERLGQRAELVGGAVLILVGAAIATGVLQQRRCLIDDRGRSVRRSLVVRVGTLHHRRDEQVEEGGEQILGVGVDLGRLHEAV